MLPFSLRCRKPGLLHRKKWSRKASAMDYVRNNWQRFYEELLRLFPNPFTQLPEPADPGRLYKLFLGRFKRENFYYIKDQRTLPIIRILRWAVRKGVDYRVVAGRLGLSPNQARRLRPYAERRSTFNPRQLSSESFRGYLKEFNFHR